MRKLAKTCLAQVLNNPKNITTFEKEIANIAKDDKDEYNNLLFNLCGDILSKTPLKEIFISLKQGKVNFNGSGFDIIKRELQEEDDFIANPFEVSEGVLQCKCGSNKTISYPLQTRSGDEKTSVYVCCVICGKKWVE